MKTVVLGTLGVVAAVFAYEYVVWAWIVLDYQRPALRAALMAAQAGIGALVLLGAFVTWRRR